MLINEIKISNKNQNKKRVGRGGKRGTYSGRGLKGQKSRAGHKIRPAERELIQRLPKFRGYKNRSLESNFVLNVSDLEKIGSKISLPLLRQKKILNKSFRGIVKILGQGEIKSAVEVENILTSKTAKEKIESAGGKVIMSK